jgi:hypothetical protein
MTRIVSRLAIVGLIVSAVTAAQAQTQILGIRAKVGYHWSSNFRLRDGSSGHLEGPEFGVDFPLSNIAGLNVYASPSIVLGGKLGSGGDTDGNIYRFMVSARKQINFTGLFAQLGVGVGHTESRSGVNAFRDENAFITSFTVGTPFKISFIPAIKTNFEGTYYASGKGQLRGFTLGLSASF